MNNERLESLELEHNRVLDELDGINNRLADLEYSTGSLDALIKVIESERKSVLDDINNRLELLESERLEGVNNRIIELELGCNRVFGNISKRILDLEESNGNYDNMNVLDILEAKRNKN